MDPILPGFDLPTTAFGREVAQRPQFPQGRYKGPGEHVGVNGYDIARIEEEAAAAAIARYVEAQDRQDGES